MNLPVRFIAVDGHGGSGKSRFAEELAGLLKAQIIHIDNFAGYDNPNNWWQRLVSDVFVPIQAGQKELYYDRSKWWKEHTPEPIKAQPVSDIMILEGVQALRRELREFIGYGIYVKTPRYVCIERGILRDSGKDDKSDEEIIQMWHQWYENEEEYIKRDNPEGYADVVIDGMQSFDEQIRDLL